MKEAPVANFSPLGEKKFFALTWLLFFAASALVALFFCAFLAQKKEDDILNKARSMQLECLDQGVEMIYQWRKGAETDALQIANSPAIGNLLSLSILSHNPEKFFDPDYLRVNGREARVVSHLFSSLQQMLNKTIQQNGWPGAALLDKNGDILVYAGSRPDNISLPPNGGVVEFGALALADNIPQIPVIIPLRHGGEASPLAFLRFNISLSNLFENMGKVPAQYPLPVEYSLIFDDGAKLSSLAFAGDGIVVQPTVKPILSLDGNFPFFLHGNEDGGFYSTGKKINSPHWLLWTRTPANAITAAAKPAWIMIYSAGATICLVLSFILTWIWRRHEYYKWQKKAGNLKDLSAKIKDQKILLDSINSALGIGLLMLDENGNIRMLNKAIRDICPNCDEIPGDVCLEDLLPADLARSLRRNMPIVNDARHAASMEVEIPVKEENGQVKNHIYRVSLYPAAKSGTDATLEGIIIFQDITQFRENARISRERQSALISALGQAIESIDPNLVGHSEKLENVAELLAGELRLEESEKETLRIASRLSQVGKLFVPRDLLTKKDKLTPQELAEVRRAPQYADKALSKMYFDLPVRETVAMIGEKLDGSGMPRGLIGQEITMPGRILAIANAFIAMISPRAWREGETMSVDEAIRHLRAEQGFDQHIVSTLAAISPEIIGRALNLAPMGKSAEPGQN